MVPVTYDFIVLGAGIISTLEAIHQTRQGKSVLIIDQADRLGGAWACVDLFGLSNVENAVHYFLHQATAFEFLEKHLAWEIENTPKKYRILPKKVFGVHRVPFDNSFGRLLAKAGEEKMDFSNIRNMARMFRLLRKSEKPCSRYVKGGCPAMVKSIENLLLETPVPILWKTYIEKIEVDTEKQLVRLMANATEYRTKVLYVTHGSRLSQLGGQKGHRKVEEKIRMRPQLHLLLEDATPRKVLQAIFHAHQRIRYAHDISRFSAAFKQREKFQKLVVVALHEHVQQTSEMPQIILKELSEHQMCGKEAKLLDFHWTDTYLNVLSDHDLQGLETEYAPLIQMLKTGDFTEAVSLRAEDWKKSFPKIY